MQRDRQKAQLTRQWLAKAGRDLLAAERALVGSPPLRDVAAYHCQQAAEKALKGYLTWHNHPFHRSHDLLYLVKECETIDPSFDQLREAAALLNPYATGFRYPGDVEEPTPAATDQARHDAVRTVEFVRTHLPAGVLP